MSRKGNYIDSGAMKRVFGHLKNEFFRGRMFPDFKAFKNALKRYIKCWSIQRRRVKLKGTGTERVTMPVHDSLGFYELHPCVGVQLKK